VFCFFGVVVGVLGSRPQPQNPKPPIPNPQSPKLKELNIYLIIKKYIYLLFFSFYKIKNRKKNFIIKFMK